jgi:hypothetical protein
MMALVWADGDLTAGNKDKRESNAMMMSATGIAKAKATMRSLGEKLAMRVMGSDERRCVRWSVWRCGETCGDVVASRQTRFEQVRKAGLGSSRCGKVERCGCGLVAVV